MKLNRKKRKLHYNSKRPQVLVLSKAGTPINVNDYEDSLGDYFNGRAIILESYDHFRIRSGYRDGKRTVDMFCPSVIQMLTESKIHESQLPATDYLPCTRRNIYERDNGHCAYCDREITFSEFTVDHVYPEEKGGLWDWYNVRAACYECNNEKDNKTMSELGWEFKRRVDVPYLVASIEDENGNNKEVNVPKNIIHYLGGKVPHTTWKKYCYWTIKMKEKIRDHVEHVKRDTNKPLKKYGRKPKHA